ncbi:MAG: type IV pili twitching motility protein PilT, partial [Chloroflexi bacterium CG15_BIG_FIL_POST_REV_8_21_14_020_46_15]
LPQTCKELAMYPRGLVVISGPTGAGKSTTLAAMINHINLNTASHIISIEDPIEYTYTNINSAITQRELGADTHSFAEALKHVLRQDPDVIMVG